MSEAPTPTDGVVPGQRPPDGDPARQDVLEVVAVHLAHAELALDDEDARLHRPHGAQREVRDAVDGQPGRDLDDERVLPLVRRVAAGPGRRGEPRRELALQVRQQQVDPQFRRCGSGGAHAPSPATGK